MKFHILKRTPAYRRVVDGLECFGFESYCGKEVQHGCFMCNVQSRGIAFKDICQMCLSRAISRGEEMLFRIDEIERHEGEGATLYSKRKPILSVGEKFMREQKPEVGGFFLEYKGGKQVFVSDLGHKGAKDGSGK